MNEYDDINRAAVAVERESPFVEKLREYVALERANEERQADMHRLEKQSAEAVARMNALRKSLLGYLEPEKAERSQDEW